MWSQSGKMEYNVAPSGKSLPYSNPNSVAAVTVEDFSGQLQTVLLPLPPFCKGFTLGPMQLAAPIHCVTRQKRRDEAR